MQAMDAKAMPRAEVRDGGTCIDREALGFVMSWSQSVVVAALSCGSNAPEQRQDAILATTRKK